MAARLSTADPGFEAAFTRLVAAARAEADNVGAIVAAIVEDVRLRGDAALLDYTRQFDRAAPRAEDLRVEPAEIARALKRAPRALREALDLARARIEAYHRKTKPRDGFYRDRPGLNLGWRWTPIDAAGLYVPGGRAAYPSSVLMNAVPAKVAGVRRLVMVVPAPDGKLNPLVLAAAAVAGVDEVYRVGGAQAIAALAYGTATIRPVDKIVGPGNAYVAAAKRLVFGEVGIDMIAGPSEVVVVADRANDPAWIAADLLAQAEHDPAARSLLITDDTAFAGAVELAVARQLKRLSRAAIAGESWARHGAIILVRDIDKEAPALIDRLAPEHLQLALARPRRLARRVRHAGAIFLGRHAPEALGDYIAGPNHVLPTSRTARFSSGLGTVDFLKRASLIETDARALAALAPAAVALARAEGLSAHAASIALRIGTKRR